MTRTAARIFGIIYLLVGILGFIPALLQPADGPHVLIGTTVNLLGLFPVNAVHDLVHILIGFGGILAAASFAGARSYFRTIAVLYAVLAVFGIIPLTNTLFGLAPLTGLDVGLHALTAIVAAYFGWGARPEVDVTA